MIKLFVVFGFTQLGNYPNYQSGFANTFVSVPKVDEENIRALPLTIMRANPNSYREVCVTNFIEVEE